MENEKEEEVTQNVPIIDQNPLATESQRLNVFEED